MAAIYSNEFKAYLNARKIALLYAAQHNIIWQAYDDRMNRSEQITEPEILSEWVPLLDQLRAAKEQVSAEERDRITDTRQFCVEIGHFRMRQEVGRPRYVCIACLCMFDADVWADQDPIYKDSPAALNLQGAYGERMPGSVDFERGKEFAKSSQASVFRDKRK